MTILILNTLPSAPTCICGYCGQTYTASTCTCSAVRWIRTARAAELAGRLIVERQGVADPRASHAGPASRAVFRSF